MCSSDLRWYQLEQRALQGLVRGCEPPPRGRAASPEGELARLRHDNERLTRECQRQQALVRLARQAAGLAPPPAPAKQEGKKRRPRKASRGQQAARRLRAAADGAAAEGSEASVSVPGPEGPG